MCGRVDFSWTMDDPGVQRLQEIMSGGFSPRKLPDGEGFPGSTLPVLVAGTPRAQLALMRWGLPYGERSLINARAETAADKPLFRTSFLTRRCVLPTTGFYEWSGSREKYRFRLERSALVYLAGFYDEADNFVLLTRAADRCVSAVHHRMPEVLRQGEVQAYLRNPEAARFLLLRPAPLLVSEKVSA